MIDGSRKNGEQKKADKSENKSSMEMFVENDNDSGKIII